MTRNRTSRDARPPVARIAAAVAGALVLGVLARELPAVVRYVKIRSM
ncbi:hypothetical protein SAXI111661_07820 [Saccharomonospora xinjiangensis]|nr:hypothetical protein [Saccharomonospora xinjiangensis]QBQ59258.1 hypothetical protein EYD13_04425 [Saccharomonospora xinjiangensis]